MCVLSTHWLYLRLCCGITFRQTQSKLLTNSEKNAANYARATLDIKYLQFIYLVAYTHPGEKTGIIHRLIPFADPTRKPPDLC